MNYQKIYNSKQHLNLKLTTFEDYLFFIQKGVFCLYFSVLLSINCFAQSELFNVANSNISYDVINDIIRLENGELWIATEYGLNKFYQNDWQSYYAYNYNLPGNEIRCLTNEADTLWIGTFNNGAFKFKDQVFETFSSSNSNISSNFVRAILVDENEIWFATSNGLNQFDQLNNNWNVYNVSNPYILASNFTDVIKVGNVVFASSINGGIVEIEGYNIFNHHSTVNYLPDNTILEMAYDTATQIIWMASPAAGIVTYDFTNFTSTNPLNSSIPTFSINSIAIANNENNLSIAGTADNGVYLVNENNFAPINTSNSILPNNKVNKVYADGDSLLWIGTDFGLFKYDPFYTSITSTLNANFEVQFFSESKSILVKNEIVLIIKIFDLMGNCLIEDAFEKQYDLVNLSSGIYVISISDLKGRIENLKIKILD